MSSKQQRQHPVTRVLPPQSDHRYWVAHWGLEMVAAMLAAAASPRYTTAEDLEVNHAVRCARTAWRHAKHILGKDYQ